MLQFPGDADLWESSSKLLYRMVTRAQGRAHDATEVPADSWHSKRSYVHLQALRESREMLSNDSSAAMVAADAPFMRLTDEARNSTYDSQVIEVCVMCALYCAG